VSAGGRGVAGFRWVGLGPTAISVEHQADVVRRLREIELAEQAPLIERIESGLQRRLNCARRFFAHGVLDIP